jgi:hypothetical protein
MRVDFRTEPWRRPDGQAALVEIEVHADGSEVVPVSYDLMAEMLTALGFERQEVVR